MGESSATKGERPPKALYGTGWSFPPRAKATEPIHDEPPLQHRRPSSYLFTAFGAAAAAAASVAEVSHEQLAPSAKAHAPARQYASPRETATAHPGSFLSEMFDSISAALVGAARRASTRPKGAAP